MSLLRRTTPDSSLAQTAASSTPPAPRQSPFGSPTRPPAPPARPFGAATPTAPAAQYSVIPIGQTLMRFQLKGLGDPFHRLLGDPLNLDYGAPQKAAEALQKDEALHQRMIDALDAAWEQYHMVGALLLHPYDAAMQVYTAPLYPVPAPDEDEDATPAPAAPKCELVRSIDLALVLNVLARVRDGILVAQTPLALEPAFLDKVWVTSESRLVKLGRATGCLEDVWA